MRRKRYQTHEDIRPDAMARARAGLHPAVAAAAEAAQAAQAPELQRVSGEMPAQKAAAGLAWTPGTATASPPAGGLQAPAQPPGRTPYHGGLNPSKLAGSMGGSAADLGIQLNRQEGNPRGGQHYREFIGGDGFAHHVYADGTDIRVKRPGGDQENVGLRIAAAARDGTGNPAPPGPQDATGQPDDLAAVHALPPDQQEALMVLASAAAAQRSANALHPELSIMPRRRRR